MSSPDIGADEVERVLQVLKSGRLSQGEQLELFEELFAAWVGVPHAIGVSSGTAALHLCLLAAGIGEGDEVITTPFSFISSANAILYVGATPLFVDVDARTGNIDPGLVLELVQEKRRKGDRLRTILPVHIFGQCADMEPILELAQAHDLRIIEDACEAPGGEYRGRKAGAFGDASAFGFYPNKPLTTGEGGMILTPHPGWADRCRSLRNQGRNPGEVEALHPQLGFNYRLDELSAALGASQVERAESLMAARERVARWYLERLEGRADLILPEPAPGTTRISWFVFVVRIEPPERRRQVQERLRAEGIPSRAYFHPIHLQPWYRDRFGYRPGEFPRSEWLGSTSLALPFSGVMAEESVDRVSRALLAALDATRSLA